MSLVFVCFFVLLFKEGARQGGKGAARRCGEVRRRGGEAGEAAVEEWTGVEWAAERQRGSEAAREADGGGCAAAAGTKKKKKRGGDGEE